jgi:thioredoxin 1
VLKGLRRHPVHDDQDELLQCASVLCERAETGVTLGLHAAKSEGESRERDSLDETCGRDEGDARSDDCDSEHEDGEPDARAATPKRAGDDDRRAQIRGDAANRSARNIAPMTSVRSGDRESGQATDGEGRERVDYRQRPAERQPAHENADRRAEPGANSDPVPPTHRANRNRGDGSNVSLSMTPDHPRLVFFTSQRSGPARRMESLLAHIARRERDRLSVSKVDVDERPEIAERFKVTEVPALALVVGKKVVSRLDGRATAPRIEEMLAEHLDGAAA